MCSKRLHIALDFAIAQNLWPVKFVRGEESYDMTIKFILATWGCYAAQMCGKPALGSKACGKVLAYMLSNVRKVNTQSSMRIFHLHPHLNTHLQVVESYRRRVYFYASATIVKEIEKPLKKWLATGTDEEQSKRTNALVNLRPEGYPKMLGLVGDVVVEFMRKKHSPFPLAFQSKEAFLRYQCWKRAQIWLRSMRVITGLHANKHWNKYGYSNYKLSVQVVKRYMSLDAKIIQESAAFQNIKTVPKTNSQATPVKRKKSASGFDISSPECPPASKTKIIFSSSSEEES